jgi:hypothetical protein
MAAAQATQIELLAGQPQAVARRQCTGMESAPLHDRSGRVRLAERAFHWRAAGVRGEMWAGLAWWGAGLVAGLVGLLDVLVGEGVGLSSGE